VAVIHTRRSKQTFLLAQVGQLFQDTLVELGWWWRSGHHPHSPKRADLPADAGWSTLPGCPGRVGMVVVVVVRGDR